MPRKPSNLLYGVDENPGAIALILMGLQHISLMSIAFIFPVIIIEAIGGKLEQAEGLIRMAMLATGIGTILQAVNRGPVGSGYLCPLLNGPAFLSASLMAGKMGGLSLIFGMTAVAGVCEVFFSRLLSRMRAVFPAEVTGTIVTMVGIEVVPLAVRKFVGIDPTHSMPDATAVLIAMITLGAMACFNVWGRGKLRLYSALLGMVVGYGASAAAGLLNRDTFRVMMEAPFFALPAVGDYGVSFQWILLVPFLVAALSSALKTMGDLTTCQKINDAQWKRPDMVNISGGVLACGISNILSGMLGALGQSVSSSNIGLSIATGATSRRIAYSTGIILVLLAFFPKFASIFVIMPTPIMGASLIFAVSFMILAGLQIIMSRMIDARKTFVIGISIIFGLSIEFAPGLYRDVHPWIKPIFSSSLSLATICAVVLNLIFRIGIAKTTSLVLTPGEHPSEAIDPFMEEQGRAWGARSEVIYKAKAAMIEFYEAAAECALTRKPVTMTVRFDEFNLDVDIAYEGKPIELSASRPDSRELLEDPDASLRLAGYMIRSLADQTSMETGADRNRVHLHFNH
ncbi:MAG TPA: solute carrier family 23 protein [Smithellaceae bacterium]|nr:solute carrier family 23 protein [Smithellaceae bacterium]HRS82507.1 solute carrier family 23 protein [Smithellaceae bacterium]HRV44168.1 solute carrier family 23 protein [Smithellaceae bacterium]